LEVELDGDLGAIFSRKMRVSAVGVVERRIEADAGEREALAKAFGIPAVLRLAGDFALTPEPGGVFGAKLRLSARVKQVCVVTLEEFEAEVREEAMLRFVPARAVKEGVEIELDPDTLEGPDEIFYAGEVIDLGAALAEQLALALDPYPRRPGAALSAEVLEEEAKPLAGLAKWKGKAV